jgi:hypothetical protein
MSLTSDWQGYVSPKYRVSPSAAHLVHVEPSFYMPAPHKGSQNKKETRNVFYEEMWPIFFLLKLTGMFPYCVSSSGKPHMRWVEAYIWNVYNTDQQNKAINNVISGIFSYNRVAEEPRLLKCDAVSNDKGLPMFRRIVVLSSLGLSSPDSKHSSRTA